jgi:soluble cytochrome b562
MIVPAMAQDKDHTPLGDQMESVNDAFKAFRRETDPVKGATQAREAHTALIKSLGEVPVTIKEMPEGPEKAKALVAYRKMMGNLYVTLCDVEEAFLNGKVDEVAKIIEKIKELKKEGHKKFVKEEE